MSTAMQVGDRFTSTSDRRFTEDGVRRMHHLDLLCEVVSTDAVGFAWNVVEVLNEENRPTTFAPFVPTAGTTAWFGWAAAVERGDVQRVR